MVFKEILTNQILASWLVAIGTFFLAFVAIFVAIFQEQIKRFMIKPKLDVEINTEPPDCHKTTLTDIKTGESKVDCYYFRFKIWNNGNYSAKDSEVAITKLFKKQENGQYNEDKSFLPLNLLWSHYRTSLMRNIQRRLVKSMVNY